MKRAVFYLALALSVSPALAGSEADTPRDMVLLTMGGLVSKTNRGPVDAKARRSARGAEGGVQERV